MTSVTMKDIIAEAGYSHGAIYKYYKNLDEVVADLLIRINVTYSFDDALNEIFDECGTDEWQTAVREICDLFAKQMVKAGPELLKISLYSQVFAVSDPKRAKQIAVKIGNESISPLQSAVDMLRPYLEKVIRLKKLRPTRSVDELIHFIIAYYSGVESAYVFSDSFYPESARDNASPENMFSCLADALILMLKGGKR